MNSYELYIPPKRSERNAKNGRFLKGNIPHNKGKKWSDYLSKRAQKKCMKGWLNVISHHPASRPDVAERCRKPVIGIMDDGKWLWFPFIGAAAKWVGGCRENVRRCCQLNQKGVSPRRGIPNTDHKHKGVRFYYENDSTWTKKT